MGKRYKTREEFEKTPGVVIYSDAPGIDFYVTKIGGGGKLYEYEWGNPIESNYADLHPQWMITEDSEDDSSANINVAKEYVTRCGKAVKLYTTDAGGIYPVHGAIEVKLGQWNIQSWTIRGQMLDGVTNAYDLVEKPKVTKGWINLYYSEAMGNSYPHQWLFTSKERADEAAFTASHRQRIACLYVEFKEGEGL